MDRRLAWVLGIVFGGGVLCFLALMAVILVALRDGEGGSAASKDSVGVIEIVGEIRESKKTLKAIRDLKDDKKIRAVVVRIDSPGGAVAPSQEIFHAIRDLAKTKKVVASMGSLAASGGFYIACGAEKVFANPGTLTGSIGVVMQLPNVSGVMKWAGVEMRTLTAGKLKDAGSPFREMSPEERTYFEGVLKDVHQQFIDAVATGRGLKQEDIVNFADGRVMTGRQAHEWKLVDQLGGFDDAVAFVAKEAGISGEPELHYPKKDRNMLREIMGDNADALADRAASVLLPMGLAYRVPLL